MLRNELTYNTFSCNWITVIGKSITVAWNTAAIFTLVRLVVPFRTSLKQKKVNTDSSHSNNHMVEVMMISNIDSSCNYNSYSDGSSNSISNSVSTKHVSYLFHSICFHHKHNQFSFNFFFIPKCLRPPPVL